MQENEKNETRLTFFVGALVPEFGKVLGGHAEIGSLHILGKPVGHERIFVFKFLKAFFSGFGEVADHPALHVRERSFGGDPEKGFKAMVHGFQLLLAVVIELHNPAILQSHHKHRSRLLKDVTVVIRNPPVFDGQLNNVFLPFITHNIPHERSFQHVVPVLGHKVGLDDELPFFDAGSFKAGNEGVDFRFRKFHFFVDVLDQGLVFRHASNLQDNWKKKIGGRADGATGSTVPFP